MCDRAEHFHRVPCSVRRKRTRHVHCLVRVKNREVWRLARYVPVSVVVLGGSITSHDTWSYSGSHVVAKAQGELSHSLLSRPVRMRDPLLPSRDVRRCRDVIPSLASAGNIEHQAQQD